MDNLRPALRYYLWAIVLAAGVLLAWSLVTLIATGRWRHVDSGAILVFIVLTYLSERMIVRLRADLVHSMSTVLLIASALVLTPPAPALIACVVMLAADFRRPMPLYKRLYNVAHSTLSTGCANLAYASIAAPLPQWAPGQLVARVPAILLVCLVYAAIDIGSIQVVLTLAHRQGLQATLRQTARTTLVPDGVAVGTGVLAALAWAYSPAALPLVLLPLVSLRRTFRAIEQAEHRAEELRRRNAQLDVVIQAGQRLTLQQPRVDLLRPLATAARDVAGARAVAVYLRDDADLTILDRVLVLPPGAAPEVPAVLPVPGEAPADRVRAVEDDVTALIVPLHADGQTVGELRVVGVASCADADTTYALSLLATQAAIAIQNAQLHERVLAQVSIDGLTGLPNHRAFQARLDEELARCRRLGQPASLLLLDIDGLAAINTAGGLAVGDATLTAVAATVRHAVRAGDIVARYGGDEFAVLLLDTERAEAIASANHIQTAIRAGVAPLGVRLSIGVADFPAYATTRESLVRAATQALAGAKVLGKDRIAEPDDGAGLLEDDLVRVSTELAHRGLTAVKAMAVAVDAKDAYTRGHSQRVSRYAVAIGRALDLAAPDLERLELAALLHDVGKIAVPDAILKKEQRLSDAEFAIIKEHPVDGERMLSTLPYLARDILPAVRHHHERWDGRGYPDGLAGAALPLDAAILAVADAFDAMTSTRTYRRALAIHEAARRIREGSGTQFAPHVVLAFERALAAGDLLITNVEPPRQGRTA